MSFHHLDTPEYQGPGVTQLHDTAIEAGLVTAPERSVPDDVLHYNKQLQLDADRKRKQQQRREEDDSEQEDEEEEDEQLMEQMRERLLSQLQQQHDTLITAATSASNLPHLLDISEDDFKHHCLTSSHSHLTLLLLHCNTPACVHMSQLLATLGRLHPSAVRCIRLRATGDNIAHFPLAACPTTMAYREGRKVGQWGLRDWKRAGTGGQVEVGDVVRELRRCGLLQAAEEDEEEAELTQRNSRLRTTRGGISNSGRRRGRGDSSSDDDEVG